MIKKTKLKKILTKNPLDYLLFIYKNDNPTELKLNRWFNVARGHTTRTIHKFIDDGLVKKDMIYLKLTAKGLKLAKLFNELDLMLNH